MRRLDIFLLATLIICIGLKIIYIHDVSAMEASLEKIARKQAAELAIPQPEEDVRILGTHVTASRDYLIAGPAHGKITVYTAGTRRGIPAKPIAFDFFYRQEGGSWEFEDSGACLHGESHELALDYLAEHPEAAARVSKPAPRLGRG